MMGFEKIVGKEVSTSNNTCTSPPLKVIKIFKTDIFLPIATKKLRVFT